jgi:hypothetical protein
MKARPSSASFPEYVVLEIPMPAPWPAAKGAITKASAAWLKIVIVSCEVGAAVIVRARGGCGRYSGEDLGRFSWTYRAQLINNVIKFDKKVTTPTNTDIKYERREEE